MHLGFDKEKTTMDELLDYYAVADPSVVNIAMRWFKNPDKTRGFKVHFLGRAQVASRRIVSLSFLSLSERLVLS